MNRSSPKKSAAYVQLQKTKLENQIKELDREISHAKCTLFQLVNKSTPYCPSIGPNEEKRIQEYEKLCQYFNIDPNVFPEKSKTPNSPSSKQQNSKPVETPTIVSALQEKMNYLNQQEKAKQAQLEKLKRSMALLSRQQAQLEKEKNQKQITLINSFEAIKLQFEDIKSIFWNFRQSILDQIAEMRKTTMKQLREKIDKSKNELNKYQEQVRMLQNKRNAMINAKQDKLARLSYQRIDDQTIDYVYDDSKLKEMVKNYAVDILTIYQKRITKFESTFMVNLNLKFDAFYQLITQKVQKFDQIKNERKERLSKTCIKNWTTITKVLLKYSSVKSAIHEYRQELKTESNELEVELEKERKLSTEKVPGTDLTVLELRKEIAELTCKLSTINQMKTAEKIAIECEHETFKRYSQKQIEALEIQNK